MPPTTPGTEPCPFCRIVRGESEAWRVLEGEHTLAILDHRPLAPGHCLLLPRVHVPTLRELPEDLLAPFLGDLQRLALAVESALGVDGSLAAVNVEVSQSVPHLHAHLIPRRHGEGLIGLLLRLLWRRGGYRAGEAERVAGAIRRTVDGATP